MSTIYLVEGVGFLAFGILRLGFQVCGLGCLFLGSRVKGQGFTGNGWRLRMVDTSSVGISSFGIRVLGSGLRFSGKGS
jgi:hypothetical protein